MLADKRLCSFSAKLSAARDKTSHPNRRRVASGIEKGGQGKPPVIRFTPLKPDPSNSVRSR